jgi:putative cofactor-binding repeat protein
MKPRRDGKRHVSYRPRLERVEDRLLLATLTVDTADDENDHANDTLSLREAIEVSNGELEVSKLSPQAQAQVDGAVSSPNTIDFNIPGTGPFTITLQNNLPQLVIREPAMVDGYSQPGASPNTLAQGDDAKLQIELSGVDLTGSGTPDLTIVAGNSRVSGLVINQFMGPGILIQTTGNNLITGNFIGTDVSGTQTLEDKPLSSGVEIETEDLVFRRSICDLNTIGGTTPADRNVISTGSTGGFGVEVEGSLDPTRGDVIQGNFIGSDVTGTKVLGNGEVGVLGSGHDVIGGSSPGAGNLISGNAGGGIYEDTDTVIQGNLIGTDVTGSVALGNGSGPGTHTGIVAGRGSTLGGPNAGNVVVGCQDVAAVEVFSSFAGQSGDNADVIVQDNYIGTDITGTKALGNLEAGLELYSHGGDAIIGNVISGNGTDGIVIDGDMLNDVIQENFIGTDPTGTIDLGNGALGLDLHGEGGAAVDHAVIGGSAVGAGNVVAFNGSGGIVVDRVAGVRISRNSIFSNTGMGIDFNGHDAASAGGQAPPVLTFTPQSDGTGTLMGTLQGPPVTAFAIEIFANDPVSPSLAYQGKTFVGDVNVTTDPDGQASFELPEPVGLYTATAIDPDGNTTEFSNVAGSPALTATTTMLGSSSNPSTSGSSVTFIATVTTGSAGGAPAGTVNFEEGQTLLGTGTLDGDGNTTFQTASLAPQPATHPALDNDPAMPTSPGDVSTSELDGPTIANVRRFGVHMHPTYLEVTFSRPLDPTRAGDPANYRIVAGGADARPGHAIAVTGISYDPTTATVTLRPQRRLNLHRPFRLTIRGTGAGGVADTAGRLLDGERLGQPGGDATTIVTWKNLVIPRPGGRGIIGLRTLRRLVWPK